MGPEIQWLHSYVTGDKVYCVYLAPDEATVQEHAKRTGLPANRVSAVRRLIDPEWQSRVLPLPGPADFLSHLKSDRSAMR